MRYYCTHIYYKTIVKTMQQKDIVFYEYFLNNYYSCIRYASVQYASVQYASIQYVSIRILVFIYQYSIEAILVHLEK